ncbi:hypothetical protein [Thiolapillus sp.]|uniref:hypothetical protein n=1 Tax=Thiolapillus sp. TaxID=2017437 RepID=UPI0025E8DEF8|nr:hypothetical protein [Thiolapillus sp.]
MTRTAGAPIGCQRPSRFWGLGCPKIYHEAEDTLVFGSGCVEGGIGSDIDVEGRIIFGGFGPSQPHIVAFFV